MRIFITYGCMHIKSGKHASCTFTCTNVRNMLAPKPTFAHGKKNRLPGRSQIAQEGSIIALLLGHFCFSLNLTVHPRSLAGWLMGVGRCILCFRANAFLEVCRCPFPTGGEGGRPPSERGIGVPNFAKAPWHCYQNEFFPCHLIPSKAQRGQQRSFYFSVFSTARDCSPRHPPCRRTTSTQRLSSSYRSAVRQSAQKESLQGLLGQVCGRKWRQRW